MCRRLPLHLNRGTWGRRASSTARSPHPCACKLIRQPEEACSPAGLRLMLAVLPAPGRGCCPGTPISIHPHMCPPHASVAAADFVAGALVHRPALARLPWADLGTGSGAIAICTAAELRRRCEVCGVRGRGGKLRVGRGCRASSGMGLVDGGSPPSQPRPSHVHSPPQLDCSTLACFGRMGSTSTQPIWVNSTHTTNQLHPPHRLD